MTMSEIMIHSAFILLHIIIQSHLNMPSEFSRFVQNQMNNKYMFLWLSGRALRQQRKRLWVRFPGNTH